MDKNISEELNLPPLTRGITFSLREIREPIPLHEQEKYANTIIDKIFEVEKKENEQFELPAHLEEFRKYFDPTTKIRTKLPIISQLSPRTKRKIAILPKPNEFELKEIRGLEKMTKEIGGKRVYDDINEHYQMKAHEEYDEKYLANSNPASKRLIPRTLNTKVEQSSTLLYERGDKYKRRKAEQQNLIEKLFIQRNPSPPKPLLSLTTSSIDSKITRESTPSTRMKDNSSSSLLSTPSLDSLHSMGVRRPELASSESKRSKPTTFFPSSSSVSALAPSKYSLIPQDQKEYLNEFSARVKDEIGIDLNKEYNRLRNHKQLLMRLCLHFYVCRVRSIFSQWVEITELLRKQQEKSAANKIARIFLFGAYMKRKYEKKYYQQLQMEAEKERIEKNDRFVNHHAAILSRNLRRYGKHIILMRLVRLRQAATKIQKVYRGGVGRKEANELKIIRGFQAQKVLIIQKQYRRRLAIRHVRLIRKLNFVNEWIDNLEKKKKIYREEFWKTGAELFIAKRYRAYVMKKKLKVVLYWYHYSQAIIIQRMYRGYKIRTKFKKFLKAYRDLRHIQEKKAVIIQKYVRRFLVELLVSDLLEHKDQEKNNKYNNKLLKLAQGLSFPEQLKFSMVKLYRVIRPFRNMLLEAKILLIQRVYRGFHGRKRAQIIKIKNYLYHYQKNRNHLDKNALMLQKHWRGFITRKHMRDKKTSMLIIRIQCAIRMHRSNRKLRMLKKQHKAALFLTYLIRRMIIRRKFQVKYRREKYLSRVCVQIQCFFRFALARRKVYRLLKENRKKQEEKLKFQIHLTHVLCNIQLYLLSDTMLKPIQRRYYSVGKVDCIGFGPMQGIFIVGACNTKSRLEHRLLGSNKVDNTTLLKYLQKIVDLSTSNISTSGNLGVDLQQLDVSWPNKESRYLKDCVSLIPENVSKALKQRTRGNKTKAKNIHSVNLIHDLLFNAKKYLDGVYTFPSSTLNLFHSALSGISTEANNNQSTNAMAAAASISVLHQKTSLMVKEFVQNISLVNCMMNQQLPLPKIIKRLSTNEIDLIFNKCKENNNVTNRIGYGEFLTCLQLISYIHYEKKSIILNPTALSIKKKSDQEEEEEEEEEILDHEEVNDSPDGHDLADEAGVNQEQGNNERRESLASEAPSRKSSNANQTTPGFNLAAFVSSQKHSINQSGLFDRLEYISIQLQKLFTTKDTAIPMNKVDPSSSKNARKPSNVSVQVVSSSEYLVDYRMAILLRILFNLRDEPYVQCVLLWIHFESLARLSLFAIRIQCFVRNYFSRKLMKAKRLAKLKLEYEARITLHVVMVQKLIRGYLQRNRTKHEASKLFIRYIPYLDPPYYYNPQTKVQSYKKPHILHELDCQCTLFLPEKGLENIIHCTQCSVQTAEVYCVQCEDSFCKICYYSLHCRGSRLKHYFHRIPMCTYCKFQHATKTCVTCILNPPIKDSYKATIPLHERGIYCDTCFIYEHDVTHQILPLSYQQQTHVSKAKSTAGNIKSSDQQKPTAKPTASNALTTTNTAHNSAHSQGTNDSIAKEQHHKNQQLKLLINTSQEMYLLSSTYLHRRIQTNHHYSCLTQNCEECCHFSASWYCMDCRQVYCHRCLIILHSKNPAFALHHVTLLPYYTPIMHIHLQKDLQLQRFHLKWEKLKIAYRQYERAVESFAVLRIQAWWRMHFYRKRGKLYMKKQRMLQRIRYTKRKKQDVMFRHTFKYKMLDFFGMAPELSSDTREEQVLKRIPAFRRYVPRSYINPNLADWGYYRISRSIPRKGYPKKGFDVGEIEELTDQAHRGGYRLPGRVIVKLAHHTFHTTHDLTKFIRPGHILRIREYYFGCIQVTHHTLKVNRLWRDLNINSQGEIVYRMPTYTNERHRFYHKIKYSIYDYTIGSPVTQLSLWLYRQYHLRAMTFSLYMMRMNKKNKLHNEAKEWKEKALQSSECAKWAASYFKRQDFAFVDLSKVKAPDAMVSGLGVVNELEEDIPGTKKIKNQKKRNESSATKKKSEGGSSKVLPQMGEDDEVMGDDHDLLDDEDQFDDEDDEDEDDEEDSDDESSDDSDSDDENLKNDDARKNKSIITSLRNGSMDKKGKRSKDDDKKKKGFRGRARLSSKGDKSGKSGKSRRRLGGIKMPKIKVPQTADEIEHVKIARKNLKYSTNKIREQMEVKAEKPWYANKEQELARKQREDKMSLEELSLEASHWKESIDIMTENIFYINIYTNEMMTTMPRALQAKRQLEFENSRNKKAFDDAQRRIERIDLETKNRLYINGIRKR